MDTLELDLMMCFGDKPNTHHRIIDFGNNPMMLYITNGFIACHKPQKNH